MLFVSLRPIGMNLYLSLLEDVNALFPRRLDDLLTRGEYFFMDLFGDFNLELLCPVAYVKQAGFQNSQRVLSTDLLPQVIVQLT